MYLPHLRIPALPAVLGLALLLAGCATAPEEDRPDGTDNGLAYRVTDTPVVDGENLLLEKYDFYPEADRISESVPSSTPLVADPEAGYIPPAERWVFIRTTKGDIRIKVRRDWAPNAADRFIELVEEEFFNGAPWFRVNEIIAQSGIAADPETTARYDGRTIPADPMFGSNLRGTLAFVQTPGDPASRNTQFFINLEDNLHLDGTGAQDYFVPFAEVMSGMEVADQLHVTGDPRPGMIEQLASEGVMAFRRLYTEGDYIEFARLEN